MLIKNVHVGNDAQLVDIRIENGFFSEIGMNLIDQNEQIIDGEGGMAVAPFIEPHIHLDTALTAGEPRWNESGTLFEGIAIWSERKKTLTKEDIKTRALKTVKMQIANGVQFIRTHVDVTDPHLTALKALIELREELRDVITIQIVAFPQEGILSYPNGKHLLEEALKLGADVIGAIPHFEFTREYGVQSIDYIFELAQKYNLLIDVHCDEIDDEQSRFVEVVAARAYEYGLGQRVTASHTTAMGSYNDAYAGKLFRIVKMSGINFVSNPLVNIHLQGRFDTYPKRRGLTRVKELNEAGLNVCFGHDDIFDHWYPMGTGNMLQVLNMGLHISQMMGYRDINESLKFIGQNGARALQVLPEYGIEIGKPGSLIILPAENGYDAVRRQTPVQYSIRRGQVLLEASLAVSTIHVGGSSEVINYKK
ncbi:MAG: cytosine deaminase [Clostridiaceae bacterium]